MDHDDPIRGDVRWDMVVELEWRFRRLRKRNDRRYASKDDYNGGRGDRARDQTVHNAGRRWSSPASRVEVRVATDPGCQDVDFDCCSSFRTGIVGGSMVETLGS